MKKENKIAVIALIAALLIAGIVYMVFFADTGEDAAADPVPSGTVESEPVEGFTVTFLAPDDSVLYVARVEAGSAAVPPENPTMPQGYVFSHWDADFSCVTEDMTVYAVCAQVADEKNVLALSGGYARQGDTLVVPLRLCGDVCVCAFDIRVTYDPEMLTFVEFRAQDGAADTNCPEEGVICLNYASMENTIGEVDLTDLVFAVAGQPGQTALDIEVVEMIAYDADYNFVEPEYMLVPGTIEIAGS